MVQNVLTLVRALRLIVACDSGDPFPHQKSAPESGRSLTNSRRPDRLYKPTIVQSGNHCWAVAIQSRRVPGISRAVI